MTLMRENIEKEKQREQDKKDKLKKFDLQQEEKNQWF